MTGTMLLLRLMRWTSVLLQDGRTAMRHRSWFARCSWHCLLGPVVLEWTPTAWFFFGVAHVKAGFMTRGVTMPGRSGHTGVHPLTVPHWRYLVASIPAGIAHRAATPQERVTGTGSVRATNGSYTTRVNFRACRPPTRYPPGALARPNVVRLTALSVLRQHVGMGA
jgi:hypothetical protein